ncbi:hypothetical protein PGAL8A_00410500 [Plasmodium gallinaceum]|uniref:Uncharacterized protein n=1 Tax=Plasmodium gallinaceum TaxID=5849 RepID=A0A1J1GQ29_PLAGA|nr:hypothetical protein PGAL8A_00410500 [Plasmodium gallinaceum]CRG94398.1 hypothetical protein PGAL8A_00410500 [Plasmodium gallinaceum]
MAEHNNFVLNNSTNIEGLTQHVNNSHELTPNASESLSEITNTNDLQIFNQTNSCHKQINSSPQMHQSMTELRESSTNIINITNEVTESKSHICNVSTQLCNLTKQICNNTENLCNNTENLCNNTGQLSMTHLCNSTTNLCNTALQLCNGTSSNTTVHRFVPSLSSFERLTIDFFSIWLMYGFLLIAVIYKHFFQNIVKKLFCRRTSHYEPISRGENEQDEARVTEEEIQEISDETVIEMVDIRNVDEENKSLFKRNCK